MSADSLELGARRKRQAALMYHFSSLEYLKGLLPRVEGLILYADALVRGREHLDKYLMSERWGARDTSANWSTYGFPALVAFRESVLSDIYARSRDVYGVTGANQCARMLAEYSLMWMTPDQEKEFAERFRQTSHYARQIDRIMRRSTTVDDRTWWVIWNDRKAEFPKLPKFQVRTDIEGESGNVPPRTGVYIPQDDPWGTPQFAWSGGDPQQDGSRYYDGELGKAVTFNALGLEAMETVGRSSIWPWDDLIGAAEFLRFKGIRDREGEWVDASSSAGVLADVSYEAGTYNPALMGVKNTTRSCKWFYVELLEGEYEDTNEPVAQFIPTRGPGMYAKSGEFCPHPGVWECVERPVGAQTVAFGVPMPKVDGMDVVWRLLKSV